MRKALKAPKGYSERVMRGLRCYQIAMTDEALSEKIYDALVSARRLLGQKLEGKNKIFSLHEPERADAPRIRGQVFGLLHH
jgi:IS5 family transposase